MVYYIISDVVTPPVTLFMGEDKFENEELIKWGWPEDVWFHVDKLSSAHVYLRLRPGETLETVPPIIIEEACQLVKDNSITGRKQGTVDVVYTMWSNLKKTPGMEAGQVGFHKEKEVILVKNVAKKPEVVKRLEKTKSENQKLDFRALREERDAKERLKQREFERKQRELEKVQEKKRAEDAELRNYTSLMKSENMKSNQDGSGSDSDDFMRPSDPSPSFSSSIGRNKHKMLPDSMELGTPSKSDSPLRKKKRSISSERVNPFEQHVLASLGTSMWSPSVFTGVSITAQTPEQNDWNIDQLANLYPKNLEQSPGSHTNPFPVDSETEEKAQAAIHRFFSSGLIAPSPDGIPPNPRCLLLNRFKEVEETETTMTETFSSVKTNAYCNTEISFPPTLPPEVESILQSYMLTDVSCSSSEPLEECQIQHEKTTSTISSFESRNTRRCLHLSLEEIAQHGGSNQTSDQNITPPNLNLSFGEKPLRDSFGVTPPPPAFSSSYNDPFNGMGHEAVTPTTGPSFRKSVPSIVVEESPCSALGERLNRCQFTPDAPNAPRSLMFCSPDITPIRENGDRKKIALILDTSDEEGSVDDMDELSL